MPRKSLHIPDRPSLTGGKEILCVVRADNRTAKVGNKDGDCRYTAQASPRHVASGASNFCSQTTEETMNANVGSTDRIIRIVVGIALIAWALMGGPVWAWIGVVPLATGLLRVCPAYSIFGMNTCGTKK
jgi:hypothetical protein